MYNTGKGKNEKGGGSVWQAHAYGQANKFGSLAVDTNVPMWEVFQPKNAWFVAWAGQNKMSTSEAQAAVERTGFNIIGPMKQLQALKDARYERAVWERKLEYEKQCRSHFSPWKPMHPQIKTWMKQYVPENKGKKTRYNFLVLLGDSKTAKTSYAQHLFGVDNTLVVDCQKSQEPNLGAFFDQKCIVFDEATVEMCIRNKLVMQAGVSGCQVQESPTQQYTQWKFLYGVAIVVCTNSWLQKEHPKEWHDWLGENSVVIPVTDKLYVE